MKRNWALISAFSVFGLALGLFLFVMLAPVGFEAYTRILITDTSAATEDVVDEVIQSEMYAKDYKRKYAHTAKKAPELAEIHVEQLGFGPIFELTTVASTEHKALQEMKRTAIILDEKSQEYFGAHSDTKVLFKAKVSEYPPLWMYAGASGAGLFGGFLLGLAISGVLTNNKKSGSVTGPTGESDRPSEGGTPKQPSVFAGLPEVDVAFQEDVPWVPQPEKTVGDVLDPDESDDEIVLEPIEPFSEPSDMFIKEEIAVDADTQVQPDTTVNSEDRAPVLKFGQTPSTEPVALKKDVNSMSDHFPQA